MGIHCQVFQVSRKPLQQNYILFLHSVAGSVFIVNAAMASPLLLPAVSQSCKIIAGYCIKLNNLCCYLPLACYRSILGAGPRGRSHLHKHMRTPNVTFTPCRTSILNPTSIYASMIMRRNHAWCAYFCFSCAFSLPVKTASLKLITELTLRKKPSKMSL